MGKLIVIPSSLDELEELSKLEVDGFIIGIDNYSVELPFYVSLEDTIKIIKKYSNKEIIISLNKIMHNNDLDLLKEILFKLSDIGNVKVMFYDMSVYKIVRDNNLNIELIVSQEHLNTSINSNKFYEKLGIKYSYISSDITKEELLDIKKNTNLKILFNVYGYIPIFNSRRSLVTNYLDYINTSKEDKIYYIEQDDIKHPIVESKLGSTIYTKEPINLINRIKEIEIIDYYILNSFNIDHDKFIKDLERFINKEYSNKEYYVGFFDTKTIYKVKNKEGDI